MKEIHLISVGKIKDQPLLQLEHEYHKRITFPQITLLEIKNSETKEQESTDVIRKISDITKGRPYFLILLTEHGKIFDSIQFSKWFYGIIEEKLEKIILVINGSDGPSAELKKMAHFQLSLSPLTFAHQLARILLLEQIFRAQTIQQNHPYHK